jgi:hypothetical protein
MEESVEPPRLTVSGRLNPAQGDSDRTPLNNKRLVWNLMYVGAIICALICVTMIYEITTTQNTANEWIVWTCVIIGFTLFALGFLYESKNREDPPEAVLPKDQAQKSA